MFRIKVMMFAVGGASILAASPAVFPRVGLEGSRSTIGANEKIIHQMFGQKSGIDGKDAGVKSREESDANQAAQVNG